MIDLNGIKLKNRILIAAGALEYGRGWPWERPLIKLSEFIDPPIIDLSAFGAIVTKTLTLEQRGSPEFEKRSLMSHLLHFSEAKEVLRKVPGGWLNNMRWRNVGIDYYIEKIYPETKHLPIIVNIGGFSVEEYLKLIEKLNQLDIVAIEINISCANVELSRELRKALSHLFRRAKMISKHPLILKIGAREDDIQLAQIAAALGFNAVTAINAPPGVIVTKQGAFKGAQSGRRIKETALYVVSKLKEALSVSGAQIIGCGGIGSWKDCQDFFEVGAKVVQIGSAHFFRPWVSTRIIRRHSEEAR